MTPSARTPERPCPASSGAAPLQVVYLSGGVGGARFLVGLDRVLPAGALQIVVNTGDDFDLWGLRICPDLDTVMYTLAGLSNWERGWGLADESHRALSLMARYGAPDWFRLSDGDLATHLRRTALLRERSLTEVTRALAGALGIHRPILPMTDAPVQTVIETQDGRHLPFQEWFVKARCQPRPRRIHQTGRFVDHPGVLAALDAADLVLIGPSNPYVSIGPMLAGEQTLAALSRKPCIGVSPIVGGRAVKGPLAGMIAELEGIPASAGAVAAFYARHLGQPLRAFFVEHGDEPTVSGLPAVGSRLVMETPAESERLAQEVLDRARAALRAGGPA